MLAFNQDGKQLVITDDGSVLSKPPLLDPDTLSPCTEADTRLLLHANRAGYELWLAFGTRKHFRYLACHEMAIALRTRKAQALPMFHALTGCDTVSSFVGHGKKTAWSTWNVQPQLTDAMLNLSCAPSNVQDDVMHTIEQYVILLYDRTSTCTDIDKARRKMFARRPNVKQIPPTKAALELTACEESNLSRRSCVGSVVGSSSYIAFANQLGMDKDRGWLV